MEYDIFREELAIKYPAQGHALWIPSPGALYSAVEVGDVGFIRQGRFHRLFNVLLSADDPSHRNFGVPEYYEPLVLQMFDHIISATLSPKDFRSKEVTVVPGELGIFAAGPEPVQTTFSCSRKQGAILSLPVPTQSNDTLARGEFAKCILKYIDVWFAFARGLGLGVTRMEDIILVTGRDLARSWANVAFSKSNEGEQVTLGVQVSPGGGVEWQIPHEHVQGGVVNYGPSGQNLPENQCIFIRGFRVTRFLGILPRLQGAAEPTQGSSGDEPELDTQITSTQSDTDYQDPLHTLLDYLTTQASDCDMALVHDDNLRYIDVASLENLQPAAILGHLRNSRPEIWQFQSDVFPAIKGGSEAEIRATKVVTLSKYEFEALPHNPGSVYDQRIIVRERLFASLRELPGENSEITRGTDAMLNNSTNTGVGTGTRTGTKGGAVTKNSDVPVDTHTGKSLSDDEYDPDIISIRNELIRSRSGFSPSFSPPLLPAPSPPSPPHRLLRPYRSSSTPATAPVTSNPSRSALRYLSSPTAPPAGEPAAGMQAPPEPQPVAYSKPGLSKNTPCCDELEDHGGVPRGEGVTMCIPQWCCV